MYESPVELFDVADYTKKVNEEIDNYIYEYIIKLGINVNKEELIKALQYDREQYYKGYEDGLKVTDWHPYPKEKPTENREYNITIKSLKRTTSAYYFTEDDTWYGSDDLYVPNGCITAWADLPEPFKGEED